MVRPGRYRRRERFFKIWFVFGDFVKRLGQTIYAMATALFTLLALLFLWLVIFHFGFYNTEIHTFNLFLFYRIVFTGLYISAVFRIFLKNKPTKLIFSLLRFVYYVFGLIILLNAYRLIIFPEDHGELLSQPWVLIAYAMILILVEFSKLAHAIAQWNLSPAALFSGSFLILILMGTFLLSMPKSVNQPISFIDALFTSTSAVCVTGLTVVDTVTTFTPHGHLILMLLIQLGGLGIMTFTVFFAYVFTGSPTLKDRFLLRDLLSSNNLNSLFGLLLKIFIITILTEASGALIIFYSLPESFPSRFFLAVFHSVSAFCNAGFSLFPSGLANSEIASLYLFQITIAMLVILGGLGFPVLVNVFSFFKTLSKKVLFKFFPGGNPDIYRSDISTHIVLMTSFFLILAGTIGYLVFEYKGTLQGQPFYQQILQAFFASVSARTAGFNIVNISQWTYPTVFMMILLMWVGASPNSTGGGIKTTTLALAWVAIIDFLRGKNHVEIFYRQIAYETILRVVVIIMLSLIIISIGFISLMILNPQREPLSLLFEAFSAFGTVGLSIVDSSTLSPPSRVVLIALMFIGRVGPVALLNCFVRVADHQYHQYPKQNLMIN